MKPLFEVKPVDREFYETRLRDFLPPRIIDIHTHLWRAADFPAKKKKPAGEQRTVTWPARVAKDNPAEDLRETYRLMFPRQQVTPLVFATLPEGNNLDVQNRYVAASARKQEWPALIFSHPSWSGKEIERRIRTGGFIGAKSYLSVAPSCLPAKEIRIYDYFPHHQLEVYNRNGWIVMLHIPRDGRIRDPVNLAQLMEIEEKYPRLKLIVAHVGRAYCDHDIGNAFDVLAKSRRMFFDFSANTNDHVFERLIRCVGPKRILFGSDMPITRMRMRRITEGDHYVNLVPRGLYGDVSGDKNMGEVDGAEASRLTFFLYEEIDAFRRAAERAKLGRKDIERVFYRNALEMVEAVSGK